MASGIDYDLELTKKLEAEGLWLQGTLLQYDDKLWFVIGYKRWGDALSLEDIDDSDPALFYDAVLFHLRTGILESIPLISLTGGGAKCLKLGI
jgi:hypothetical protein